jgi:signal transduction histidine kinase
MRRPDRPLKVLIVDDDPEDHILTEDLLRDASRAKFQVLHAYTPNEAWARMLVGDFDVCLLDYALGPIDGVQLYEEARREGYEALTILLSGHDDTEVADQVLDAGLADYLEKANLSASSLERAILYAIERENARREIVELNHSLETRVRERTQELESFCYSVSHDLRAPLRAINATSAILKEDFGEHLPPEALSELARQAEASERLGKLIDDLLQFVRLGQTQAHRIPFDLTALAHAVATELRIDVDIEPGMKAMGDATLVRLLVMNLLDNAVKFCRDQKACVEMGTQDEAFFVRDHGIGFDPKYAPKLFQPFERLHRDGEFAGTGIGLANVKRIVERHGGKVWADGRPNEGATFFFTLG